MAQWQLALIAALLPACALAMFEDQAGTFDWYKQHVGLVTNAAFHPLKPRVCVATEQSVVGCLNLRDGSIAWRKLVGTSTPAILMSDDHQMLVVASGNSVRGFDLEGNLKWERSVPRAVGGPATEPTLSKLAAREDGQGVLVAHGGNWKVLDVQSGADRLKGSTLPLLQRYQTLSLGGKPYIVGYDAGSTLVTVKSLQYSQLEARTATSPLALSATMAVSAQGFAVISADGRSLCSAAVEGTAAAFDIECQELPALSADLATSADGLHLVGTTAGYVVRSEAHDTAALFASGADGRLGLVRTFSAVSAVTDEVQADGSGVVGLLDTSKSGTFALSFVAVGGGQVLASESYDVGGDLWSSTEGEQPRVPIRAAQLGTYRKKDKTTGFRALASLRDGRVMMLQQGLLVWMRDEGLAALTATLFTDLPAHQPASGAHGGEALLDKPSIATYFRYQLLGAKVQLKLSTAAESAEQLQLRALLSDKDRTTRDVNGFRKIILALTSTGRLVALHNGDGRILWSRTFPPGAAPTRLLPWRTYHDTQHAPEVLVLLGGAAAVFNAHTGAQLSSQPLPGPLRAVSLMDTLHDGLAEQRVYLLTVEGGGGAEAGGEQQQEQQQPPAVWLLPETPASLAAFRGSYHSRYGFSYDAAANSFAGHGFDAAAAAGAGAGVPLRPTWSLALPAPVLAVATRDPAEPIQTSVKVLSDRSIKFKYLNPNLLFIATGSPPASPSAPLSAEVGAYLVDAVSGAVLHSQSHAGARGPVTAVLADNMVVYFFWDIDAARQVACSLELYDATPGREFSVLDYLFNPNSTRPVSSFDPAPLEVVSQVYFSRLVPVAGGTTRTEQGITAKQLLLVTNTHQVYALDRRWVDPRRPKKAKLTQDEMEEGLVPYQDTLPLAPLSYATLDKQVLGARGVLVEPTRLESTCLLLVTGVDLFYTRLSPAKGFDSLEDDFNYVLLVVALLGLLAGSAALRYLSKQSALKQKWK